MVQEIQLNNYTLPINQYKETSVNGLKQIAIDFKVTSENYHDIAVLLYEENFDVQVPANNFRMKAAITQYYTSVTNLYREGEIGDYHVTLREVLGE
ncbi:MULTISPECIES: DUF3219 family protein [Cytobacillus]|uniref:DUF3219 domain-containing protein n=1 Tax=Cytobacillus kochii TaxID=859143 RepID=A0A248TMY9_9BACI|nr:DUF3219 family protein [Cytobacillus kochii]ASV69505.1 DUF3219 domain-containing protein [Cytobacillus kochii]MDQ0184274.1 hypothetical protein [Cytobacillus kochii]MED1604577.1 DUF3219 family protein [Cytobacillus kochii]